MTLIFPNPSRSYDESRHSIRFSGYDGAFEVLFSVDADVLPLKEDASRALGEGDYLSAFDRFRETVLNAACKAYSRGRKEIYLLKAVDFR